MIEVAEVLRYNENGVWSVTFKYWVSGECACTAEKIKRQFDHEPTKQDLINSI